MRAFKLLPIEELQQRIDWFATDAEEAYEALARKAPDQFLAQVRSDVSSDFAAIKQRSIDNLRERFGTSGADYFLTNVDQKIETFVLRSLRQAAARVLADLGSRDDRQAVFAMLASDETDVREACWHFFERLATTEDAPLLSEAAMKEHDARLALRGVATALRVAPSLELAVRFIEHGGDVAIATLQVLRRSPEIVSTERLEALLKDTDASIRKEAVAALLTRLSPDDLESLLLRYISQDSYFYNVVCWLDRILYAPTMVRPYYLTKLGI